MTVVLRLAVLTGYLVAGSLGDVSRVPFSTFHSQTWRSSVLTLRGGASPPPAKPFAPASNKALLSSHQNPGRTTAKPSSLPASIQPVKANPRVSSSSTASSGIGSGSSISSSSGSSNSNGIRSTNEGASISNEVFNLIKAIVGVGVLSLPAGIAAFGNARSAVIPAIALIVTIGLLSAFGFAVIGKVCAYTDATSYRQAWESSVGSRTSWIPAWTTTGKTFLACLAFSMVLADTFASLANQDRLPTLAAVTALVLLPLCWRKDLQSLAPFSLVGVLGILYTAIAMTIRYLDGSYDLPVLAKDAIKNAHNHAIGQQDAHSVKGKVVQKVSQAGGKLLDYIHPPKLQPTFGSNGWQSVMSPKSLILVGMLSTAYMAHFNAPKLYNELKDRSLRRFYQVVGWSFGAAILIMTWITAIGYLTFGGSVSGLVLNNYASKDMLMLWSRVAVAVSLLCSYPLVFQGCRDGLLDVLRVKNKESDSVLNITTIGLLAVLTTLAALLQDVSLVLAVGGATLGNALTYVYPAIMYHSVCRKQDRKEHFGRGVANLVAVLGIVMGVIGAKMALDQAK